MSYTAQELLKLASDYNNVATRALVVTAEKKEKKKLDPKAKVRNRGTVCVPAEQAKDKKDHFPINDEGQARNALARVQQLTSAPWYKGSLEGLKALVARKVKAKYPKINVGGKDSKKKASEYYDALLRKLGQAEPQAPKGTPGNPWKEGELGDEVIDLDTDEEGNKIRQPVSFQAGPTQRKPAPRFDAIPPEVQEALAKLGYKGQKGETVVKPDGKGDGQLGPITQFALNQYRDKNKDKATDRHGQPISQELMYEMIKRDASGENKSKEQMFDVKTTNEALSAAQAYLTQLQASLQGGQINAKNAAQTKQGLSQYLQTLQQHVAGIYSTLQDNRSSQQERTSAQTMQAKYDGLRTSFERWVAYLDMLAKQAPTPMTDEKPYG